MATGAQVWSTTAASNNSADSSVNWAEGMAPSAVNDSARGGMASVAMFIGDNSGTLATSGTTAAYTIGSKQVSTGLVDGYTIAARIHATNDSSATLNVDGVGPKQIQSYSGQNISGGQLVGGSVHRFTYNTASTAWILNAFFGSTGAAQLGADGTVSAPAYSFTSDPDTGLYKVASNNPGMSAGGVPVTQWTTSGAINFGTFISSGAATFASSATFQNSVQVASILSTGAATVQSSLEVTGAAQIGGTAGITGNATLAGSLNVAKATTLSSAVTISGAATLGSSLTVTNNVLIGQALTVTTATQTSSLGVGNSASIGSTLHVGGSASVGSTFHVAGAASFGVTVATTGTATFQTLIVTGQTALASATINSTLAVLGATSVSTLTATQLVVTGTSNLADTTLVGGVWISYTPSITAASGSYGSANGSGRYTVVGKTCHIKIDITVSSIGSGSVATLASLPFSANGSINAMLAGRNRSGGASMTGLIAPGASTVSIVKNDGTTIASDGTLMTVSGSYEIA